MTAVQSEQSPSATNLQAVAARRSSAIMAGLCGLWIALLAYLAVTTANPVMLNIRQFNQSSLVVAGKVTDRNAGRVQVVENLAGQAPADNVIVERLSQTNVENGKTYLFPLRYIGKAGESFKFIITPPEEITRDGRLVQQPKRLAPPGDFVWPMSDETRARFREYWDPRMPKLPRK